MPEQLFVCTDLDRTLIPNGPQPESPMARKLFTALVDRPEVVLAYVSGRHRQLVEKAITNYCLPTPDFVIGDVGTTIYHVGRTHAWQRQMAWEEHISAEWGGKTHSDLKAMLHDVQALRVQESSKQNRFKLSYYVPMQADRAAITASITQRFKSSDVNASLIWSVDEPAGIRLLDILPASASKYHAITALMQIHGFDNEHTVFCGDSGNDIEVISSPIPAVLVANSQADVRALAISLSKAGGHSNQLYIAKGGFYGMNGNYSAGMLEGIAHYHPWTRKWMGLE